jgi:hypothetical protein
VGGLFFGYGIYRLITAEDQRLFELKKIELQHKK